MLSLQAAVTKLRNDAVVVPLNQQGPLNDTSAGAGKQGAGEEDPLLSSMDPDLADAGVTADSTAGAQIQRGREDASRAGSGGGGWQIGTNPKGMSIEDAFRDPGPALGMDGAQVPLQMAPVTRAGSLLLSCCLQISFLGMGNSFCLCQWYQLGTAKLQSKTVIDAIVALNCVEPRAPALYFHGCCHAGRKAWEECLHSQW